MRKEIKSLLRKVVSAELLESLAMENFRNFRESMITVVYGTQTLSFEVERKS